MKRLFIIVGLVLLGAALVFLNQGVRKSATPDKDEDEQAQQSSAPTPQKPPGTSTDPKNVLPAEEAVGDPVNAKHHIEVGWVYDGASGQRAEMMSVPIKAIRDYVSQRGGEASAEIVDLDVPVEDRTPAAQGVTALGIRVDGKTVSSSNLSELVFPPDQMAQMIESAIRRR